MELKSTKDEQNSPKPREFENEEIVFELTWLLGWQPAQQTLTTMQCCFLLLGFWANIHSQAHTEVLLLLRSDHAVEFCRRKATNH